MSHTKDRRGPGTKPTPQEEVTLGAMDSMPGCTAAELAEALTEAQQFLPPHERIKTPVSGKTAGQYLGLLRTRGLVYCDPPPNVPPNGKRIWFLTDVGKKAV